MTDLEPTGFPQFDRLLAIVRGTRAVLDAVIGAGQLPDGGADYLAAATLPHIEDVQDGFRTWLRADMAGPAELRYLIGQVAAMRPPGDAGSLSPAEREAARAETAAEARIDRPRLREAEGWHLAALAHARLVLAFMPRLPDDAVRFPGGRRTYADIAAPRGPAELAGRIEELERELWRTATGRAGRLRDPAFRRTYGFFDAAERLGARGPGGIGLGLAG
jgi:hypothetical protein